MSDAKQSIEETLAHLSRTVDELSDVIARQDSEIEALKTRVKMLMQHAAGQEADKGGGVFIADEKPPHY